MCELLVQVTVHIEKVQRFNREVYFLPPVWWSIVPLTQLAGTSADHPAVTSPTINYDMN
jgi:hypothetical protein